MGKAFAISVAIAASLLFAAGVQAGPDHIFVGRFSQGAMDGWKAKSFDRFTRYELFSFKGRTVLQADSRASASSLIKKIKIDIKTHPVLNWQWGIGGRLGPFDEKTKSGDDFAARIYVIVSGGLNVFNTKSLIYVWSHSEEKGSSWPNPYAPEQTRVIVLRTGTDRINVLMPEKRNVFQDLKTAFGKSFRHIDHVALMTDTDNTGGRSAAFYGDIFFSRR